MIARTNIWEKTIGIVGGLGPYAHIELEKLILEEASLLVGHALNDQDYPPWILVSLPDTPDRTLAIVESGESPLPWLEKSLSLLRGTTGQPGADFAVISCNTAHFFLDELRKRVSIPILDMVSETLFAANRLVGDGGRIGILATTGTLKSGLYQTMIERNEIDLELIGLLDLPDDSTRGERLQEDLVMSCIYGPIVDGKRAGGGIKSGLDNRKEKKTELFERMRSAVNLLARAGSQLVICGCTEIPLLLGREPVDKIPLLDPLAVAAKESVRIAAGLRDV